MAYVSYRTVADYGGVFKLTSNHTFGGYIEDADAGPGDSATQLGDISGDVFRVNDSYDYSYTGFLLDFSGTAFIALYGGHYYFFYYGPRGTFNYGDYVGALDPNTPFDIACYVTGTAIRTTSGDVAVEALVIGDKVVTASGEARPIKWIGRRSYAGRFANGNADVLPVCFKAGSISDTVPARDLHVSPKHAMLLDGVLIAAERLVNGVTVVQATEVEEVSYWHIELDSHDVLIAEGAASESFVDDNSRAMFHNAAEFAELYPEAEPAPAIYCASRVQDGHALHAAWTRLAERAGIVVAEAEDLGELTGEVALHNGQLIGWARNAAHPKAPVCLDLIADGVLVGRVLARDEQAQGQAFSLTIPQAAEGASSLVLRRSADGAVLGDVQTLEAVAA